MSSSSVTNENSPCSTRSRTRKRPTNASSATHWPAKVRCSPARNPSRPPGRSSTRSSNSITTPTPTSRAAGDPRKPTRSSRPTHGGTTRGQACQQRHIHDGAWRGPTAGRELPAGDDRWVALGVSTGDAHRSRRRASDSAGHARQQQAARCTHRHRRLHLRSAGGRRCATAAGLVVRPERDSAVPPVHGPARYPAQHDAAGGVALNDVTLRWIVVSRVGGPGRGRS